MGDVVSLQFGVIVDDESQEMDHSTAENVTTGQRVERFFGKEEVGFVAGM